MKRASTAAMTVFAVLLVGCSSGSDPQSSEVRIVATTSIVGDIVGGVAGDEALVEVLIPIGVDAHDFQPSAQQAQMMAEADLVVANGLGLEEGLVDVLESAAADGTRVIELAPLVDPLPFSIPGDHGDDPEHESLDPHFWMDPIRVGVAANGLADELTAIDPDGGWRERAGQYAAEFEATDKAVRELVEQVPSDARQLVSNHEALGYFADRYDFEVIGVVIPGGSTLAEPSSAEMAELVETMQIEGVRVIFAETSQPTTLAESIAAELGDDVQVVELFTETLGPSGSGGETLASMLLSNAELISGALR